MPCSDSLQSRFSLLTISNLFISVNFRLKMGIHADNQHVVATVTSIMLREAVPLCRLLGNAEEATAGHG
jgi:hypothetical protein